MAIGITQKGKEGDDKKSVIISKKIKSHENDPFFNKKAKRAEAFLNKHGLPHVYTK
jgi:hypothetical protein